MRIVNRSEFLKLPPGTLYQRYEPCSTQGSLEIKDSNSSSDNDWYYYSLDSISAIDLDDSSLVFDLLLHAQNKSSVDIQIDLNSVQREGVFNDKQLFIVWSSNDFKKLVDFLNQFVKGDRPNQEPSPSSAASDE